MFSCLNCFVHSSTRICNVSKTVFRFEDYVKRQKRGLDHSATRSAIIQYNRFGEITWEVWCRNGVKHRIIGPAGIVYGGGRVVKEEWRCNGFIHREDGPAIIRYENGAVITERWIHMNFFHRIAGPAVVNYKNGSVEEYWFNMGITQIQNTNTKIKKK